MNSEFVYFLYSNQLHLIKIGYSTNVALRLHQINNSMKVPFKVKDALLIFYTYGDREMEQELHNRFKHIRMLNTEWFKPTDDLINYMRTITPKLHNGVEKNTKIIVEKNIKRARESRYRLLEGFYTFKYEKIRIINALKEKIKELEYQLNSPIQYINSLKECNRVLKEKLLVYDELIKGGEIEHILGIEDKNENGDNE